MILRYKRFPETKLFGTIDFSEARSLKFTGTNLRRDSLCLYWLELTEQMIRGI